MDWGKINNILCITISKGINMIKFYFISFIPVKGILANITFIIFV
jgi:hypothetical protein